ncbi:2-C-methyl-D-erythritol 4-phosphate cytidylyltransferase [Nesterenkonia muleiensis]|uniref:2-C-methyl-D-erythritol 4-phosphate cytidylyltransferase n=1 Tax=Nesterenkonia muleiensis TaxID=2282648 RepID=UPI000E70B133|nr:2-C-methyl-D-erythritol 4-phosphate cytidylyltransferase [Nesterenkonia muleiensis]
MTTRPADAVPPRTGIRRALVVVAAGSGTRLGRGIPKAAVRLSDRTILDHALDAVTAELGLDMVVLVLPEDSRARDQLAAAGPLLAQRRGCDVVTITGGGVRTDSVAAGTQAVQEHAQLNEWPQTVHVLVHDAARALTPAAVFGRVLQSLDSGANAVIPALPVTDTVKRVDSAQQVAETLPRAELRAVQTPQGFTLDVLDRAFTHIAALAENDAARLTDEAMIAEELGERVSVVEGHPHALKITTETDLITARGILEAQQRGQSRPASAATSGTEPGSPADGTSTVRSGVSPPAGLALPRVGIGHDIHAFAPSGEPTELWLAGLHWPGEQGLAGHSDADPVAHAACAALFSAAGLGDLGTHFGADTIGTSRAEYKGARGVVLLREAVRIVGEAGFQVGSISVQFIGNRPRFAPRREEAQQVLSAAAGAPVAVSATTSDGLGFPGRGEGIMATATAVVC